MFKFGSILIPETQIFYKSPHCFGLVNLKPVVAGHVLVVSRRYVARFHDLTFEEAADMMVSAQKIGAVIEKQYGGTSLTLTIQDGPEAGQTIPHVHMHVIPRRKGDYSNNDDIYEELDGRNHVHKGPDNEERKPRSAIEMKEEADRLRLFFSN